MSDLYQKLYEYREKLRDRENKHTSAAILTDDALKALARSKPLELDDMLKVSGIGKAFVQKYGLGFLNIIAGEQKPVKLTMMRKEVKDTLKNLQARLTNVNRRNRMLYLPKPIAGRAIDLAGKTPDKSAAVVDALLSFNGEPVTVSTVGDESYTAYRKLMRAANAGARETGGNTLYAGYPFVMGRCGKDQAFNVCAPLVLFPVSLVERGNDIALRTDPTRDITYNNALILCFNKFNGRAAEPLPGCVIDDITKRGFITDTVDFYAQNNIKIKAKESYDLVKFGTYNDKTFPKYNANEYELTNSAVVGLFPMYSGAMQKDFDDIIDKGVMSPTLTQLLEGADEIDDFYGKSVDTIDSELPVDSEGRIAYINELNVSQERAIERAEQETALVMQGPPGTGKSQTITSMISDAVDKNKTVLVVSQKRAALSVIYSRLGRIARYALFVDDPKDKELFYAKLKSMFDAADKPAPFNSVAFSKAVGTVDDDLKSLDKISDALTGEELGESMLDIYYENMDNRFKAAERTPNNTGEAALYADCVPEALLKCGYDELKSASEYLDDDALLAKLDEYYTLGELYPWLVDVHRNLSDSQVVRLLAELDGMLDIFAQGKKFKMKREIKAFVKANFYKFDRGQFKTFAKDPVSLYNGVKAYGDFYEAKLTADSLDFCTRLYFGTLVNIKKETGAPLKELNGRLMEYCGYAFIDKFENEHRDVMNGIANYTTTVSRICQAIDRKLVLTRDKTLNALKTAFNTNMAESKRRGDMMRAIEGKRRPAPAKFTEKFAFELFRGVRVFLMTPEAVSEILPLETGLFDLLVFDEASQIYVERGIPAIARAKKLVVCGDHKQLRPSSLGDGRITVDEDEENEAVLEEESLLDIARFKFPEVMLSYHYRSRYEELIAFSNAAFYGGKLNLSPNPGPAKEPPIKVHKVNGVWEDRVNRAEAEKVVELISDYLAKSADLPPTSRDTLGVITFNAMQRDCILDLIDAKCERDPEFKARYAEEYARREDGEDLGLFVKNIENVQGDERDRIIFSFAYAYNNKGVMSRNFGWLNRPGGENRLNVAISRAKRRIDIVTSIIPSDLKVDDIKSEGIRVLRKYIDYAYCISDGDRSGALTVLNSFESREFKTVAPENTGESLKDRVLTALLDKGVDAQKDVGMGNYKLDIAVRSKSGEYVLGIECDESVLSGVGSTRERDVMRKKFMSSRGWNIMRVWSADWYQNPEKVVKDITSKIGA